MDIKKINSGVELEKIAIQLFESVGWEVKQPKEQKSAYDFDLYYNQELWGHVDLFLNLNEKTLTNKLLQMKKFIREEKPRIVVLTNLTSYYVKFGNNKFEKLNYVPTHDSHPFIEQAIEDYIDDYNNRHGGGNENR